MLWKDPVDYETGEILHDSAFLLLCDKETIVLAHFPIFKGEKTESSYASHPNSDLTILEMPKKLGVCRFLDPLRDTY
jgi:hypothetical protein